jgi:hypothetical protein
MILLGGGLLIWRYLYHPARPVNAMHVTLPTHGNPKVAGGPVMTGGINKFNVIQTAAEAALSNGIHPGANGDVLFKAGDTYLRVSPDKDGKPNFNFGYFTVSDVEWEHGYLTQGIRRILTQEDFAKEVGISGEQRIKLKELPEAPALKWPVGDREKFIAQYQKWVSAGGDEKEKVGAELIASLKKYGEQKREADLKVMADRVSRVRAILNEKQLARINPIPKWEIKTTQPAK